MTYVISPQNTAFVPRRYFVALSLCFGVAVYTFCKAIELCKIGKENSEDTAWNFARIGASGKVLILGKPRDKFQSSQVLPAGIPFH
ncbi:hypothetical protein B0H13DRAFT_1956973 [Mycena leptocephala]|nr:hypothetical protein B0H13DRAFT_1956973 [Mycena leptocephala]